MTWTTWGSTIQNTVIQSKAYSFLNKWEAIVPLTFLVVSGIIFTPVFGINLSFKAGLYIHFISFLILGIFFEVPELSFNLWCLSNLSKNSGSLKKIFFFRYILTHFVAPSAGIMTITSGLYLILVSKDSLTQGWLFWLLCTSAIGLYKGLVQHRFYIKKILCLLDVQKEAINLQYYCRSPFDNICIFSECPTYLFNYWLAWKKPFWLPNPLSDQIFSLEQLLNSRVLVGVLIVGLGSFLIIPLRFLIRKYSRVYPV